VCVKSFIGYILFLFFFLQFMVTSGTVKLHQEFMQLNVFINTI